MSSVIRLLNFLTRYSYAVGRLWHNVSSVRLSVTDVLGLNNAREGLGCY